MALQERYDIFEPGDLTGLVCVDKAEQQGLVLEQLSGLDYKIHVGLFHDDVVLKMKTHPYDVIVLNDSFGGVPLEINPTVAAATTMDIDQRRRQFLVLIGDEYVTNDEMIAFIRSVDLVVNPSDLSNLKPVLRRAVTRHKEFYHVFLDVLYAAR